MTRVPSARVPAIGFAHRGARAHAPENTLEAFTLALRLGATGLESDVWLTADGVAVLDHDGVVGNALRKRPISSVLRQQLPGHIPTVEEFYATIGTDIDVSLDVKDPAAAAATVAAARNAGHHAAERLWLCHPDWELVASWRRPYPEVRLVDSTRLRRLSEGPERRGIQLSDTGIDAINMHHTDWSGGLTTTFHRFSRLALGWDCQHPHQLQELLDLGIDGLFSDHVDRMVAAIHQAYPPQ